MFPCIVLACLVLGLCVTSALAQTQDSNTRQVNALLEASATRLVDSEPLAVSPRVVDERAPLKLLTSLASASRFEQVLIGAIDERLGARYRWGATGPNRFDCSGFVWSSFQSAGVKFNRASARSLWATFAPAPKEEEYKFGTLVFFSNLKHVGIVADKNGFYHASRHHGVIYSPFNDYWLKRIDGFRRVPLTSPAAPAVE